MSLSGHSQAIRGSVHSRQISCPVTPRCWGVCLLTFHQTFPISSVPAAAAPCAWELIVKQKVWNKMYYLMKLPMFCCRSLWWGSLLTACARRNSHDSWHLALGTVRDQLPRAEMEVRTSPQCSFFPAGKEILVGFMVSWFLYFTKCDHLIKTNLQLVHPLVCSRE